MKRICPTDPLACIDRTEGCWYWTWALDRQGYGRWPVNRDGIRYRFAHRIIYERLVGPIPDSLTLDHECHNQDATCPGGRNCFHRSCVRPDHLVPRTLGDNGLRGNSLPARNVHKTHCPQGHTYDEANTGRRLDGSRYCRACARLAMRRRRRKEG